MIRMLGAGERFAIAGTGASDCDVDRSYFKTGAAGAQTVPSRAGIRGWTAICAGATITPSTSRDFRRCGLRSGARTSTTSTRMCG